MFVSRMMLLVVAAAGLFGARPAAAQFFLKSPDLRGAPVTGAEPGIIGPALPDATPAELQAAMVWNIRAALNVAALQCDFEPTLLTRENYNALIDDHATELRDAYAVIQKYFERTIKNKKDAQTEFDRFLTRVYSGFSTISAQYTFCQIAGDIGHQAVFAPRGKLGAVAQERLRELRNSLTPAGEQQFPYSYVSRARGWILLPPWGNELCWKKGLYVEKKCGPVTAYAGIDNT